MDDPSLADDINKVMEDNLELVTKHSGVYHNIQVASQEQAEIRNLK